MRKPAEEIKEKMEFWFFKYYKKALEDFDGTEAFTLFDLLEEKQKKELIARLNLRENELPVLILKISEEVVVVNTTERFIRMSESGNEPIEYTSFAWHDGYESILVEKLPNGKHISVKTNGYLSKFKLRLRNKEIILWDIPTGSPGFAFWNVTKRCEWIGQKYLK